MVSLYSAAGIDPEVSQVVASCLLTAEHDLAIASFIFTIMIYQVEEADFLRPPGMRKYSVVRGLVPAELPPGEVALSVEQ